MACMLTHTAAAGEGTIGMCSHLWADVIAGAHHRRQLLPGPPAAHVRAQTLPFLTQSKRAAV